MKVYSVAVLVFATVAACCAAPIVQQPAPVYGPPGAFQRFQQARAMSAAAYHGLTPPPPPPAAPAPAWLRRPFYQPAAAAAPPPQQFYRAPPPRQLQQLQQHHPQQLRHPQQLQQLQQDEPRQYMMGIQGLWRYTAPVRPAPLREDQVPHQGLGATDSVTMPENAPYDPLLVTGPAAARFVRLLSDNEPHYFPAFPHTRLVLQNQQKRLDNGLNANRLGSIRPGSDFLRGD